MMKWCVWWILGIFVYFSKVDILHYTFWLSKDRYCIPKTLLPSPKFFKSSVIFCFISVPILKTTEKGRCRNMKHVFSKIFWSKFLKFVREGAHYYTSKKRDSKLSSNKFGLRNNLFKSILDEKASHNGGIWRTWGRDSFSNMDLLSCPNCTKNF